MNTATNTLNDTLTLVPAYGRDFISERGVQDAWKSGKDFKIQDVGCPFSGTYCSIRDTPHMWEHGYRKVKIRYHHREEIVFIQLEQ